MASPQQPEQPAQPAQQNEPAIPSAVPESSSSSSSLLCQWVGCGEAFPNPEQLYDHVCERHVGRKSTNNLNLTCAWGNCHTTTVKRDHITSHIRVHVPLKPHKCDLCGKSFKRPQDLKKHVKTHAEDPQNSAMRPHDAGRQPPNGYGNVNGQGRMGYPGAYPGLQPDPNVGYAYSQGGNMGHYAPTASGGPAAHYGQVYYPAPTGVANNGYDRKGAYSAMDQLFGNIRNKTFDPTNYNEVSNQLLGLQGTQLPLPLGGPEFGGQVSNGGGVYGPTAISAQNLPSFSNLRTKNDYAFVEEYLNQMTQTAYESAQSISMSGTGQPGSVHVATGFRNRLSHSPPAHAHSSAHSTTSESYLSTNSPTPAMTPGSSAVSYTSGHSPTSSHSRLVSPSSANPAYPTLPNSNDSPPHGMAPIATLGQSYDNDPRRRYSGSNLQRAAPRRDSNNMEIDQPESSQPSATRKSKSKSAADMNIDPALAGSAGNSSAGSDAGTATPAPESTDQDEAWVENMRVLERLRDFLRRMLELDEFPDSGDEASGEASKEAKSSVLEKEEGGEEESQLDPNIVSYPQLKVD